MTSFTTIPSSSIDADSVIDVALMTALRDNALAVGEADAAVPDAAKFGKLLAFTPIVTTNAAWAPNAKTRKMVIMCVGGGSAGDCSSSASAYGGRRGEVQYGVTTSVGGTYAATVGAAAGGRVTFGAGAAGNTTSFIGTGISMTSLGGSAPSQYTGRWDGEDNLAKGGTTGNGANAGNASVNSGAGGGAQIGGNNATISSGNGAAGVIFVWEYT